MAVRSALAVLLLAAGALPAPAQTNPATALELERQGRYEDAGRIYRTVLQAEPLNVVALFGLERVYAELERLDAVMPYVRRALAQQPAHGLVREVQFRVWTAVGGADSAAAAARGWIAALPESALPYREWALWLARRGDGAAARRVMDLGRSRLGVAAIAPHAAGLHVASGEWALAAGEWRLAVQADESQLRPASADLARTPPPWRDAVLRIVLGRGLDPDERRFASELLLEWARPEEAWTLLEASLPRDPARAAGLVRRFAEQARRQATPEAARARGFALERLAGLTDGAEAARARLEAARAFADAGELRAAERLLDRLPARPSDRPGDGPAAMATFIRVLADAGRVAEAEERYREWEARLSPNDAAALRETLAWAWVLHGELDRGERALGRDSTVGAAAIFGWIALYRGELEEARERFRTAGPYARSREEATRRSRILALIERVAAPRAPELGRGLLVLARGDTADAVTTLAVAARRLPATGGRADVLAFAGEAATHAGAYALAIPLLQEALGADSAGPAAPGAVYTLAAIAAARGEHLEAVARLEQLILSYPESALVPQARRLLDQVRGTIPSS